MKKLLVIAFASLCCATSQAAYLYWQVSDDSASQFGEANYAQLKWSNATISGQLVGVAEFNASSTPMMTIETSELTSISGGSFYIELFNYDTSTSEWNSLAVSEFKTYDQLVTAGALTTTLVSVPTAWTGGSYVAPEPTSGLLMLIGMAGLALKRRKA